MISETEEAVTPMQSVDLAGSAYVTLNVMYAAECEANTTSEL